MGEREKILKIKCENNLSFPEARKQFEQFYQARTYASVVIQGTCNKSTETHNNSTQTDDSFTEYLKKQTQEKQQEIPKGKPQEKGNPSRPGQTLKPATLEMIRKEAILAQKNPFSVFKKDDEEDDMEDDSVVFTDSSSSDHLPKGTLSRLPTT